MFHEEKPGGILSRWRKRVKQLTETPLIRIRTRLQPYLIHIRTRLQACRQAMQDGSALAVALRGTQAAAIIEFAVALPLLIVLVVGIFDFGGAFNLKQELNNAVREGARFGAAQPTNDLTGGAPPSVSAIRFIVDSYLLRAHLNDCGLSTAAEILVSGSAWQFTGSTGCTTVLKISRQVPLIVSVSGTQVTMLCTTVQISYPYQWHFNNVIQLLVPGANYTLGNIQSDATAANMN